MIQKPNKEDYTRVNSYRPISLLSVLNKIFEKIIMNRLWYSCSDYICSSQLGFRKGFSCEGAVEDLICAIEGTLENGNILVAIFIDFSNAFNHTWHPALLSNLIDANCISYLIKIIASYLKNRKVLMHYASCLIEKELCNKGAPQGGILSGILWIFFMMPLLLIEFKILAKKAAFADDFRVTLQHPINDNLQFKLTYVLENIKK